MDEYDPHFIPNHSDDEGRYAYDQQVLLIVVFLFLLLLLLLLLFWFIFM